MAVQIVPVTSAHVRPIARPVMGPAPTSPVIREAKTSVTPVFVRTAKRPAVRRFTAGWALGRALTVLGVGR